MNHDLKTEATEIINTAVRLGLTQSSKRFEQIRFASKGLKELTMMKTLITECRKGLVSQFETYAKDGTLEELKTKNADYFKRLWIAKFDKEPKL